MILVFGVLIRPPVPPATMVNGVDDMPAPQPVYYRRQAEASEQVERLLRRDGPVGHEVVKDALALRCHLFIRFEAIKGERRNPRQNL